MVVLDLVCDSCGSTFIIETREGYTCAECGLVLEMQKLEYHRPYNDIAIQHTVSFGTTQIGSKIERNVSPHSEKYKRFNKLHSIKDNEKSVAMRARIEISRILNGLNMPDSYKDFIFAKFIKLRSRLRPGTKYRNLEKLIPICIYLTLKLHNISVNKNELLSISKISKKEFNAFLLQIKAFMPQFVERNKKKYVEQKILEITEHFELGMPFFYQSKQVMNQTWNFIKNTKDDVIAVLVSSIVILSSYKDRIAISNICDHVGIRMSTINSQVKKLFEKFHVQGFVSLVKSSNLLEKLLVKMDIID